MKQESAVSPALPTEPRDGSAPRSSTNAYRSIFLVDPMQDEIMWVQELLLNRLAQLSE